MACRRLIQKFDRLSADAQHHLEQQIDLLYKLGHVREAAAPQALQPVSKVIPFPGRFDETLRHVFISPHVRHHAHATIGRPAMLKTSLAAEIETTFNFPARRILGTR